MKGSWKLLKGSLLLACALSVGIASGNGAMAKQAEHVTIQYVKTKQAKANIDIDVEGNIDISGRITGDAYTKKISMDVSLQRISSRGTWQTVKTWSVTKNVSKAYLAQNYQTFTRGKYRVHVRGTVYSSGGNEKVSAVSREMIY